MQHLRFIAMGIVAILASAAGHAATYSIPDHDSQALVDALRAAGRSHESDRIELAPHGLYVLKEPADAARRLGLPLVSGAVTIIGNGSEIRRYSDSEFAIVGVGHTGKLALENLAIAEGARGAIINRGILHLDRVRVTDSTADGANAIVVNYGTLRAADSEISHNSVLAAQRDAGIVLNYGRMDLLRSRMAGNTVTGRRSSVLTASALLNLGDLSLREVTIEGNSARSEPDDLSHAHSVVNVGNGNLQSVDVRLVDNLPEDTNALPTQDPDSILP
ncbi:MAG: hypothetical protein ABI411_06350 [Tahibacter sp.]